jgi:HEAT repeat protein
MGEFRTATSEKALLPLTRSKSYLVSAAAARALGKAQSAQVAKVLRQLLHRPSWAEVIRASALSAISRDPSPEVMDLLLEWSRYGKPLRARRAALSALSEVGEGNKVRLHLEELLTDRDPHIRSAVVGALGALGDTRSQAALSSLLARELDGGVKTRTQRVLAGFAKESNAGVRDLKEENTKLKQEIQALGRRLSKLEQRTAVGQKAEPPKPTLTAKKASTPKRTTKKKATKTSPRKGSSPR